MPLKAWGTCFHGLVTNGQLSLPSGALISYPQPDGGECRIIDLPIKGVDNLTTQEKSDLLVNNDVEFLDYEIASGAKMQIAGVATGVDFVYQSPDGKSWGVDTSGISVNGASASGFITLQRLDDFQLDTAAAPPAATYTVPVSLADIGQSAPVILASDTTTPISADMQDFESFKPDGSECIIRLSGQFNVIPEINFGVATLGFLKLMVSGTEASFAATLSVDKNRLQTLGSVSETLATRSNDNWNLYRSFVDDPQQIWVELGDSPPSENYTDVGGISTYKSGFTDSRSISNKLISVQYDKDGNKVYYHLNANWQNVQTHSGFSSTAWSTGNDSVGSFSSSGASTFSITLDNGVDTITLSGSGNKTVSESAVMNGGGSGIVVTNSKTWDRTFDGDFTSKNDSSITTNEVSAQILSFNTDYLGLFASSFELLESQVSFTGSDVDYRAIEVLDELISGFVILAESNGVGVASASGTSRVLTPISKDDTAGVSIDNVTYHPVTGQIVKSPGLVCFV